MANGKGLVIEEIRDLAADENVKVPQRVYNRLMMSAIVELYDTIKPMSSWEATITIVRWVGVTLGAGVLLLLLAMLTHTFTWPF
jgi:uncharacterized membrane protein YqhA